MFASGEAMNILLNRSHLSTPSPATLSSERSSSSYGGGSFVVSPRVRLEQLNDAISGASPGHLRTSEFWRAFVGDNFSKDAQLRIHLSLDSPTTGNETAPPDFGSPLPTSPVTNMFEFKSPTMIASFFENWCISGGLTRLFFEFPKAVEMTLPNGFALLGSLHARIESVLGEGCMLVRQNMRARIMFDVASRIHLIEFHFLDDHEEYFLVSRSINLLLRNFVHGGVGGNAPFECLLKWGFPPGLLRFLDVFSVMSMDVFAQALDIHIRRLTGKSQVKTPQGIGSGVTRHYGHGPYAQPPQHVQSARVKSAPKKRVRKRNNVTSPQAVPPANTDTETDTMKDKSEAIVSQSKAEVAVTISPLVEGPSHSVIV